MSAIRTQLTADAVAYHASLAYGWEHRYRKHAFQLRHAVLLKCLEGRDVAGRLWLDAGCGTGTLSRWLAARGCGVLGVDAASEMIVAAAHAAKAHEYSERLTFVRVSTIARLALDNNLLDGILCSSVLEYVPDPVACLAEFARVLKPGGLLLVSVPNRHSVVRRVQVACHRLGGFMGQHWAKFLDYSRHEYSRQEFQRLLSHAGFSGERLLPFGSPLPRLAQRSRGWAPLLMFVAQKSL
jgi:2-polyprenyl-3-methyl-5-hydroxy-6-metoxy-1,4-benzoquinol methylase